MRGTPNNNTNDPTLPTNPWMTALPTVILLFYYFPYHYERKTPAILGFPICVGGYANFRQSFPEWCEDEVINANLQSGCAATEQLMGLR